MATAGSDGKVRLWNLATQKQIGDAITAADGAPSRKVAFSHNGALLATVSGNGVQLWNAATHRQTGRTMTATGNRSAS